MQVFLSHIVLDPLTGKYITAKAVEWLASDGL